MKEETFLNFCMGMQCANISYKDVFTIINELNIVAKDNGYDNTIFEEMMKKLN